MHIIPKSYGGKDEEVERKTKAGEFLEVQLKRGEALVMGPGLVHRGTGYNVRNSRLFVAFLGGRSSVASFLNTYNVYNIVRGGEQGIVDLRLLRLRSGRFDVFRLKPASAYN